MADPAVIDNKDNNKGIPEVAKTRLVTPMVPSVAYGGLGVAGAGLALASIGTLPDSDENDCVPFYLFTKFPAEEMLFSLLLGGFALIAAAKLTWRAHSQDTRNKCGQGLAALGGTMMLVGALVALTYGFSPGMDGHGCNQPHGREQRGIFGAVWSVVAVASLMVTAWSAHKVGIALAHEYSEYKKNNITTAV